MPGFLDKYATIFWDFDGVIKDSVDVKTMAYERLFLPYGASVSRSVREHHEVNGGMSRFDKIPLYLRKAGVVITDNVVEEFCSKFSNMVMERVINSPWVPGALEYLKKAHASTRFVLVTATPKNEIEVILERLGIRSYFQYVYGAPLPKTDAIAEVMTRHSLKPEQALMIGDASADLIAAVNNSVCFLLRQTPINGLLQKSYTGPQVRNFYYE
jgi:HAD superfamily hydrolase (TIGR01549 family)